MHVLSKTNLYLRLLTCTSTSFHKTLRYHKFIQVLDSSTVSVDLELDVFSRARKLFDELPQRNVVNVTALIGHFAKQNYHREAIYIFSKMLECEIRPNEFTFGTMIHSSIVMKEINFGKQLHASAVKRGLSCNVFVCSAMLDFYVKLSAIEEAEKMFEDTDDPNVVSYTALIHGYLKEERMDEAMKMFRTMPERNVVSWNAMISGYSQTGHNEDAVNLFVEMLREGVFPSQSSFPSAITAASNIAALGIGKSFHASAVKFLGEISLFTGNSLISFYAKCGSMDDSLLIFKRISKKNIVSWNAIICGFAQNGMGKEAIELFETMKHSGVRPNGVTILGLLWACNHAGLVNEGYLYFNEARLQDPSMLQAEHYACMVDLLSRSGRFYEAKEFIRELHFDPGIGFWKAVLGGCQIHADVELGEFAARKIQALDPSDGSSYVMLSNAHSAAGRWQEARLVRHQMREKGFSRTPGCSWIEVQSKIEVFVTRDTRHRQKDEIYAVLNIFAGHVMEGQDTDFLSDAY